MLDPNEEGTSSKGQRVSWLKRLGKRETAEDAGTCNRWIFSEYDRATALTNSLELWLFAQDLHKIELITVSSWVRETPMWPHLTWRDHWQCLLGEGCHFLQWCKYRLPLLC